MAVILLKDNSSISSNDNQLLLDGTVLHALRNLSNKTLEKLSKENNSLLTLSSSKGMWFAVDQPLLQITENSNAKQLLQVTVRTFNLVGFLFINGHRIEITSRFCGSSSLGQDYFLLALLIRVLKLPESVCENFLNDAGISELCMLFFPLLLNNALNQGIFRERRRNSFNDDHVRGTIDFVEHIRKNIPFNGKIAYATHDLEPDNNLTQLIRHTIEFMRCSKFGREILHSGGGNVHRNVQFIIKNTSQFNKHKLAEVLKANSSPLRHPYFTHYEPLRRLCLQILSANDVYFNEQSVYDVSGILFDIARLFEEYVAQILIPEGFVHSDNLNHHNKIYLAQDPDRNGSFEFIRYPDFYLPTTENNSNEKRAAVVLDAKYKRDPFGRDDVHQLISYMHALKAAAGAFVVPQGKDKEYRMLGFGGKLGSLSCSFPEKFSNLEQCLESLDSCAEKLRSKVKSNIFAV